MVGYIYKITSPTNRVYIGQTINVENRIKHYNNSSSKGQPRLYNSLRKYGWDRHVFEVIEECDFNIINERERYYQEKYNSTGINGLNCILTKTNEKRALFSDYTRKRMSESAKNKVFTKEHRNNIGKAHKGRIFSKETLDKMSKSHSGFKHSKKTVELIRKNSTGRISSESKRNKCYLANFDKIGTQLLNTETGIYYNNICSAARSTNMHKDTLRLRVLELKGRKNNTSFILI